MAETVSFKLDIDSKGANKTIGELRKEFNDLKKAVEETELGTEEYARTVARLGEVRADLKDLKDDMKALDPGDTAAAFANLGQTIVGGFQAASGAALLFAEGNEEIEAAVKKVYAITAIAQGLQAAADMKRQMEMIKIIGLQKITTLQTNLETAAQSKNIIVKNAATLATKLLSAAMNASPIVIFTGLLVAAAGAFALFSDNAETAEEKQEKLNKAMERTQKTIEEMADLAKSQTQTAKDAAESELKLAQARGASEEEVLAIKKKAIQAQIDEYSILIGSLNDTNAAEKKRMDEARAARKKLYDDLEALQLDFDKKKKEKEEDDKEKQQKQYSDEAKARKEANDKLRKQQQDLNVAMIQDELSRNIAKAKLDAERAIEDINQSKASEEQKAAAILAVRQKLSQDIDKLLEDEKIKDNERSEALKAEEIAKREEEADRLRLIAENEKAERERKTAEELAAEQAKQEALNSIKQSGFSTLNSLGEIFINNGKKLQKFQKALTLAQIAADTASAISSLVKYAQANPLNATTFGAAGIAQYATGIAQILANVAKAKQILNGGGGESGGGGAPSLGGGTNFQSGVPVSATNNQTSTGVNTDRQGNFAGFNQQNIKVHVVESEITDTQNSVQTIVNKFTVE